MSELQLEAKNRLEKGRKTYVLRAKGLVPGVVYGSETEPRMVSVDKNQLVKAYETAGESSLVELKIEGGDTLHVLIQDYQIDPLRNEFIHVDFRSVDMNKEIDAEVELEFVGESDAVKALSGTLVLSLETVEIRCLPIKLVRSIVVDISALRTFDDVIRVADLKIPEGIKVLNDSTDSVAVVMPPRSDAEMEALNSAVEENIEAVAVEKKETTKEETPAS